MAAHRRGAARSLGLFVLATTLLLTSAVPAQQVERFDERIRDLFFSGFAGNADALQRGMAIVEDALEADPDHPQVLVWQAAGWLFQSGLEFRKGDPGRGMTLFRKSVAQFSRAASLAPDDVGVLIPRASSFLRTARFVSHASTRIMLLETAVSDYLKVLELQKPYFGFLSRHSRGELLGGISDALWLLERRDRARVYLRRMISELPGSPYALMAQRRLDRPDTAVRLTCLGCHKF